MDQTIVGPSFMAIAERYKNKAAEIPRIAGKIITGGAGGWGNHYMNAHPQLSKDDAVTIVKYILSLTQQPKKDSLPINGTIALKQPAGSAGGTWALTAAYTDGGSGVLPLTGTNQLVLREPLIRAQDADVLSGAERYGNMLGLVKSKSFFVIKGIDLKDVKKITYNYASRADTAILEVHADSINGKLVSSLAYKPTGDWKKLKQVSATVTDPVGKHDLYFVARKDEPRIGEGLILLDWIKFEK